MTGMWRILHRLPYASYVHAWLRSLPWIVGITLGISAAIAAWQYSRPDEYLCSVEFVPPHLDELSAMPFPRVVPGRPTDLERILSYLSSANFLQGLVDTFHLVEHYGIDSRAPIRTILSQLDAKLKANITARITRNSTIVLQIYDEDPHFAFQMVEFALRKVQEQVAFYDRHERAYRELARQEEELTQKIEKIRERLSFIRSKYKIIAAPDLETGNIQVPYQNLLRNPEAFSHFDEVVSLEFELRRLTQLRVDIVKARLERSQLTQIGQESIWVIEKPARPILPSRPKRLRWIVMGTTLSLVFLSALVLYAHFLGLLHPSVSSELEAELVQVKT
ncbi:MAG: hypothetical protein N2170_01470 [Bacteroidia bacterium]|nr:hypothetical protein [Bacteroidia bacterium]